MYPQKMITMTKYLQKMYPQDMIKYCAFILGDVNSQKEGLFESLPLPILRYIFKTATSDQWKKLHKTCKYLFFQYSYILVDYLDIADWYCSFSKSTKNNNKKLLQKSKIAYYGTKHFLQYEDEKKFEEITNIWVSNIFVFNSSKIAISTLLSKISRCEIKDLRLTNCTMTEMELKFLTKWGKVERFSLAKVLVINSESVALPFEDILSYASNANDIRIDSSFTSEETSQKLTELKRTQKFKKLCIVDLDGTLDHELVYEFIKKNAGINSYFSVDFMDDPENTDIFNELLKNELSKLHWESILSEALTFPGIDPDRIYCYFATFWKQAQQTTSILCGCFYGYECTSYLYKDSILGNIYDDKEWVCFNSKKLLLKNGKISSVDRNSDEPTFKEVLATMKQRIWNFLVEKTRSFGAFFSNPFVV